MCATRQKWGYRGDQGTPVMPPVLCLKLLHDTSNMQKTSVAGLLLALSKISLRPTQKDEIKYDIHSKNVT